MATENDDCILEPLTKQHEDELLELDPLFPNDLYTEYLKAIEDDICLACSMPLLECVCVFGDA